MKFNLGKMLAKAAKAGAGAAAVTVASTQSAGVETSPELVLIISAVTALARAVMNCIKVYRKIKAEKSGG